MSDPVARVERGAERAQHSRALDVAARIGLSSRALVYGVLAWLIARLAAGGGTGHQADQQGALQQLAAEPVGHVLVIVAAAGFGAYALWLVLDAAVGHAAVRWSSRFTALATAVLYGVFCYAAATVAAGANRRSPEQSQEDLTARLLAAPGGRIAVGLVAAGVLVAAVWTAWRGLTQRFEDRLEQHRMPRWLRDTTGVVGTAGHLGRGLVVALVGAFLMGAALTVDASKSKGLDRTLRAVGEHPGGRALLAVAALGFAAFALHCVVDGVYRRLD